MTLITYLDIEADAVKDFVERVWPATRRIPTSGFILDSILDFDHIGSGCSRIKLKWNT